MRWKQFLLAITLALAVSPIVSAQDDAVVKAMRDELDRSMKKLQLENLQKPYFVAYHAVENESCSASASFGALLTSYCEPPGTARSRVLAVEVRVGDYTRDNSNFFAPMANAGVVRWWRSTQISISGPSVSRSAANPSAVQRSARDCS